MGNVPDKCDNLNNTVQRDRHNVGPVEASRSYVQVGRTEDQGNASMAANKYLTEQRQYSENGYDVERFEDVVSENFHCVICMNVFRDPFMCCQNEHIFCRVCIEKHLEHTQSCPSCMEPLTVATLRVPPRIVLSCLSEFKIGNCAVGKTTETR